jgi:hypothetical protein
VKAEPQLFPLSFFSLFFVHDTSVRILFWLDSERFQTEQACLRDLGLATDRFHVKRIYLTHTAACIRTPFHRWRGFGVSLL